MHMIGQYQQDDKVKQKRTKTNTRIHAYVQKKNTHANQWPNKRLRYDNHHTHTYTSTSHAHTYKNIHIYMQKKHTHKHIHTQAHV